MTDCCIVHERVRMADSCMVWMARCIVVRVMRGRNGVIEVRMG